MKCKMCGKDLTQALKVFDVSSVKEVHWSAHLKESLMKMATLTNLVIDNKGSDPDTIRFANKIGKDINMLDNIENIFE